MNTPGIPSVHDNRSVTLFACCVAVSLLATTALAEMEGPWVYSVIPGGVSVDRYSGPDSSVVIPITFKGLPVTSRANELIVLSGLAEGAVIGKAIERARDGDTVRLRKGVYHETLVLSKRFVRAGPRRLAIRRRWAARIAQLLRYVNRVGRRLVGPNNAVLSAVNTLMNPALVVVVIALLLVLTGCNERADQRPEKPPVAQNESSETARRLQNMASAVNELKASPDPGRAKQQVGELWIQVDHLKREGRNTRNVEGLLSDLEGRLGSNQQDASARRHLANELEYEVEAFKRRNR